MNFIFVRNPRDPELIFILPLDEKKSIEHRYNRLEFSKSKKLQLPTENGKK